jgi:hypothetical protein
LTRICRKPVVFKKKEVTHSQHFLSAKIVFVVLIPIEMLSSAVLMEVIPRSGLYSKRILEKSKKFSLVL